MCFTGCICIVYTTASVDFKELFFLVWQWRNSLFTINSVYKNSNSMWLVSSVCILLNMYATASADIQGIQKIISPIFGLLFVLLQFAEFELQNYKNKVKMMDSFLVVSCLVII